MTAGLCIVLLSLSLCEAVFVQPAGERLDGNLSRYDPQVTWDTIAYRQAAGDLPADLRPFAGMVAVADCGRVGTLAWVSLDGRLWQPVAIFDCAGHAATVAWMEQGNIHGELSWGLAAGLGFTWRGTIEGALIFP